MICLRRSLPSLILPFVLAATAVAAQAPKKAEIDDPNAPVSYYKKIRLIFQANCQGCHQPAKSKGGYVMTDFAKMMAGGEECAKDKKQAIVPKDVDKSFLVEQITPDNGEAEMPAKKAPLADAEIKLIRRWISEGAVDDTPPNARQRFDSEHLPIYQRPTVITSVDFSPDGSLLAVAGFHEILLWKADGSELVARLVGLSERIQSLKFSPDGTKLAASGGRPAQMGEIQIWDVKKQKLALSVPVGYDTTYGISWSPSGDMVAFGCPDNSVRAIDTKSGKQVLQQTSHSDWVLDTVFNHKGDQLVSVGRDMSAKLTEVATSRFIDNISSITPGALRGGLQTVARHPERDEFLVGGADGIPQAYRIVRKVQRRIGDNALLIRRWPAMEGRIYAMAFAPDGKSFAAASSLDGSGAVNFYNYDFDTEMPADILAIENKPGRSEEEKKKEEAHFTSDVKLLGSVAVTGGVYALAYNPDGKTVAAAGEDGKIRMINTEDSKVMKEFVPVPIGANAVAIQSAKLEPK
ncbi:MAG TPA: c-type cytochrome domain-containing protein [Chthoniobacter sp.]|jgi:WD40 repeat protein